MTFPASAFGQAPALRSSETIWVQGGEFRLKASVYTGEKATDKPVLLVVLHGDAPRNKPDYQDTFAARAASGRDVIAVGLLRPGYTDPKGNASDGERGEGTGDNYNARNTDAIAAAIASLKNRYPNRKVVLAGHSGGAAIAGNILGRHPGLLDAALLVSCPCDVDTWRAGMFQLTQFEGFQGKVDTLSPLEQIRGMSDRVVVTLVVGTQDRVAPASLSKSYQSAAAKLGKQVRLVQLEGKEHEVFLDPAVFAELATLLK
jgi:pimeloyl-ACP methyl ester carboxylesterase